MDNINESNLKNREKAVKKEIARLKKNFQDIPENKKKAAGNLIIQAARLRIMLNEMWEDISKNGDYNLFSQSDKQEPYERERPVAKLYNSRNDSYLRIIKQLTDFLPETSQIDISPPSDGSDLL